MNGFAQRNAGCIRFKCCCMLYSLLACSSSMLFLFQAASRFLSLAEILPDLLLLHVLALAKAWSLGCVRYQFALDLRVSAKLTKTAMMCQYDHSPACLI